MTQLYGDGQGGGWVGGGTQKFGRPHFVLVRKKLQNGWL